MNQRARSYLDRAATSLEEHRPAEAEGFERIAEQELERDPETVPADRALLNDLRARRLLDQGRAPDAIAPLEALRAYVEAGNGGLREAFDVRRRLGQALGSAGQHARAVQVLDEAIAGAAALGPAFRPVVPARLAKVASLRALGRETEAAQELQRALDAARTAGDREAADRIAGFMGSAVAPHPGTPVAGAPASAPPPAASTPPPPTRPDDTKLTAVLAQLDELIGLAEVKDKVHTFVNFLRVQQLRATAGAEPVHISHHLVFTGNPGTGKTTVARLFGRLLNALGVLAADKLVETSRSGLVAGYVGQTAARVDAVVDSALDGVLFIDEAYALTDSESPEDFGHEAINQLIKRMEDQRDRLAVIFAGYSEPMDKFLNSNPGLSSRVADVVEFPDYGPPELASVFRNFAGDAGYTLSPDAEKHLVEVAGRLHAKRDESFGNARTMRNLFEDAITAQANRIMSGGKPENAALSTLEPPDLDAALAEQP